MPRSRLPRYASLLDTVAGDFSHTFRSRNPPVALAIDEAPSLDAYVRSFKVEVFIDDWKAAQSEGAMGYDTPKREQQAGSVKAMASDRLRHSDIRVTGIIDSTPSVVFGFTTRPRLTSHQIHLYVYLLMNDECRLQEWSLVSRENGTVFDWRCMDEVGDRDLEIMLKGNLMEVVYDRSALIFRNRLDTMSDTSSSKSASSSANLRRNTPKQAVRQRDGSKCLMTGQTNETANVLGEIKVAHIVPISLPHIADQLRFVMDPRAFNNASPLIWRKKAPNHPSNLFCLSTCHERLFDDFALAINPIGDTPQVTVMQTDRRRLMSELEFNFLTSTGLSFPKIPFTGTNCPSPSPSLLLVHLMSSLAQNFRLCMTDEEGDDSVEMPRGVTSPALIDFVDEWRQNMDN